MDSVRVTCVSKASLTLPNPNPIPSPSPDLRLEDVLDLALRQGRLARGNLRAQTLTVG